MISRAILAIKVGLENHLSISGLVITNNLEDAEEDIKI